MTQAKLPDSQITARKKTMIAAWFASFFWMGVIFLFSSQPHSGQITEKIFGAFNILVRKSAHVSEYAALFCLYYWSILSTIRYEFQTLNATDRPHRIYYAVGSILMCIVYAAADEWHQSFVPGRSATIYDVLIDSAGALLGCFFWWLGVRFRKQRAASNNGATGGSGN